MQSRLATAAQSVSSILTVRQINRMEYSTEEITHCVFFLQKPTLAIASEMVLSVALIIASTERVPPTASLSFVTAASHTSSFVCDDNMSDTSVIKR